jgi:hypothetical protein
MAQRSLPQTRPRRVLMVMLLLQRRRRRVRVWRALVMLQRRQQQKPCWGLRLRPLMQLSPPLQLLRLLLPRQDKAMPAALNGHGRRLARSRRRAGQQRPPPKGRLDR